MKDWRFLPPIRTVSRTRVRKFSPIAPWPDVLRS